ncbi:MAG: Ig-like domain-containing protein [Euryarchaeota archaeon]|nr:Ig-like domain-containing protein [Euryarchaeota archaeon]
MKKKMYMYIGAITIVIAGLLITSTTGMGKQNTTPNVFSNQPPVAVDDYVSVMTDSVNNKISVLSNDYDPEGDPITLVSFTQPSHGVVSMVGGPAFPWSSHRESNGYSLYYTPTHTSPTGTWIGYGPDSFTYTINDGFSMPTHFVTATVYINVIHPTPGPDPTDPIPV